MMEALLFDGSDNYNCELRVLGHLIQQQDCCQLIGLDPSKKHLLSATSPLYPHIPYRGHDHVAFSVT